MGRVVAVEFVSLDGVIQSPLSAEEDTDDGSLRGGWVPPYDDDTTAGFMRDTTVDAAGMLLGRRSYEILTDAWADADESEPAVAAMNRMPKYVVSRTFDTLTWDNSHRLDGDLAEEVGDLKGRVDGDLVVFGSGRLVQGLAEHDLIDEYRLLLFPVVLGAGKRLFDARGARAAFTLTASWTSAKGVVLLTYTRDRPDDVRVTFTRALDQLEGLVALVDRDQLDGRTPCEDYDVRALLGHVVAVLAKLTRAGDGGDAREVTDPATGVDDDGWVGAFDQARSALERTWRDDAMLARSVTLPWATLPGRDVLDAYAHELTVHAWDLARATGHTDRLDRELGALALEWFTANLPAEERGEAGGNRFQVASTVSDSSDVYVRLAAYTGREV